MIHEVGVEVGAKLSARGCPIHVVDGPEPEPGQGWGSERIVLEHDASGDSYGPARGQRPNPKHRFTRNIGAKFTIYAQETRSGALAFEHRRRAEHVLDMVLVALEETLYARKNALTLKTGKFIQPADSANSESVGGAAYEQLFTFERAVMVATWAGAAQPEATVTSVKMLGAPSLTFAAAGFTITRSTGSWLTDGFAVGMPVRVAGSALNNGTATITALTATVMSFAAGISNEGPIAGCNVTAGGVRSTTKATQAWDVVNGLTPPGGAITSCGP